MDTPQRCMMACIEVPGQGYNVIVCQTHGYVFRQTEVVGERCPPGLMAKVKAEIAQAAADSALYGTGYVLTKPDGSVTRVDPFDMCVSPDGGLNKKK